MASITSIHHIGIVGSGKMGSDIFGFLSEYGFDIVWLCIDHDEAELHRQSFYKKLNRQLRCGIIDNDRFQKIQSSVIISSFIDDLSSCDLIIECIWEDLSKKKELFKILEPIINDTCIIASNSSSFLPSMLIPDPVLYKRFIGLHFFYPLKLKNIVEIIKTKYTSDKTINNVVVFCDLICKKYMVQDEKNAFLLNKLFLEVQNEAYKIYTEGFLSYRQIDAIIGEHLFPEGVFKFFDQVGNDVMLQSIKNYSLQNPEPYQALLDKLEDLCSKNRLGLKTKAGFYNYNGEKHEDLAVENKIPTDLYNAVLTKIKKVYIQKARQIVSDGMCEQDLLEFAAKEYMNTDKGIFSIARETLNQ